MTPRSTSGSDWSSVVSLDHLVGELAQGYKSIGEMVHEIIKRAIMEGTFAPGERLRQEALATAIGVSRIPVRSALIQLEAEGLVVFHPRRGAVVRSMTAAQIRENYELREVLEVHALRKSMTDIDDDRLAELRELANELDTSDDRDAIVDLRVKFYRKLYDAENNPQLVEIIEGLRNGVGRYLLGLRLSAIHEGVSHSELVEQLVSGDVEVAEQALRDHLHRVHAGVEEIVLSKMGENAEPGGTRSVERGGESLGKSSSSVL